MFVTGTRYRGFYPKMGPFSDFSEKKSPPRTRLKSVRLSAPAHETVARDRSQNRRFHEITMKLCAPVLELEFTDMNL